VGSPKTRAARGMLSTLHRSLPQDDASKKTEKDVYLHAQKSRKMIKNVLTIALLAGALVIQAQELPQPSPAATVSQRIGLTDINVEYSRPGMKDRVIFGDLVPFDNIWRTGANKNTTIEFSGPVQIGGKEVAAGTYSFFTIPTENEWTVILNSKTDHWGAGDYKDSLDVARFTVKPTKMGQKVESFSIGFAHITSKTGVLELMWEQTKVAIKIAADPIPQAKKNIEEALAKEDADFRAYHGSARFYLDNGLDASKALMWEKKSVEMDKKFWNTHWLAKAYKANGQVAEAMKTAKESLALAEEAKYAPYIKLNKELIASMKDM